MPKNIKTAIGSDMESELHEIMAALNNYNVIEMNEEEFNTRYYLYNRIRKWIVKKHLRTDIFDKVSDLNV